MDMPQDQIMTAQEVAQYLRLDVATVYRLARAGKIPAAKMGRAWRFKRGMIDRAFKSGDGASPWDEDLLDI
ncbi:MAG TPA: DNA-binding protein [Chloroflexi bacterium]|nr:DNA-binding protein [Chloroflexota bacterium]